MKNIILLLFVLISITACSQLPQTRTLTNEKTLVIFAGGTKVDSAFIIPHFPDTLTANYGPAPKFYAGNLIRVGDQIFMRNNDATGWILQFGLPENTSAINLSGLGVGVYKTEVGDELQFKRLKNVWGLIISDATDSVLFTIDSSLLDLRYLHNSISCGLTCNQCGVVTWTGTGLNFNVSPADYNLDYVPYHFSGDSVSLDPSDGTFNRFDAIVLTSAGLSKVTGSATADPQLPQTDPCQQIVLTYVFVQANATTPTTISDEVIYDENTETWTHATAGTITTNFAGTAQVFHLTKSITISSWNNGSYIEFTAPSSLVPNNYTTFSFWIRLTAVMINNQNISVQFFSNTTAVSNNVVGQITKGNISTYQSVGFNMSQFTFTSPTFNIIRLTFHGNNANTTYIDWVRLQAGVTQQQQTGLTNAYSRITDGTNTATATGGDIFKIRTDNTLSAVVANNDATHGDNVLMKVDTTKISTIHYVDSLAANTTIPTLQQVFDSQTGEALMNKADTVNLANNKMSIKSGEFNVDTLTVSDVFDVNKRQIIHFAPASISLWSQYMSVGNADSGGEPIIYADGGDANINFALQAKGTGRFHLYNSGGAPTNLGLQEDNANGLLFVYLKPPALLTNDRNQMFQDADGTIALLSNISDSLSAHGIPNWDNVLAQGGSFSADHKADINNHLFELDSASRMYFYSKRISNKHSYLDLSPDYFTLQTNGTAANDYAGLFTSISGSTRVSGIYSSKDAVGTTQIESDPDHVQARQKNSSNTQIDLDCRLIQLPTGNGNKQVRYDDATGKLYVKDTVSAASIGSPKIVSLVVYPDTSTGSSADDYYVYYTIPANTFANDGDAVRIEVQYATTGVDTKAVELQIGGIGVSGTASATTAGFYVQRAVFSRHGSGSAVGRSETWRELTFTGVTTSDPAINWTVDNDIRTRINSVTAGSIIIQRVEVTIEKQQ